MTYSPNMTFAMLLYGTAGSAGGFLATELGSATDSHFLFGFAAGITGLAALIALLDRDVKTGNEGVGAE